MVNADHGGRSAARGAIGFDPVAPQRGQRRAQKALRPAGAGKTQKRKSPSGIGACLARA